MQLKLKCCGSRRLVASGFNQLQVALALPYGFVRYREMMTLDWQVLIVGFVAISLQLMTSINLVFGRSAVEKCNIWRETDRSSVGPLDAFSDASMMSREQR
jgi:hypothetical protein